MTITAQQQKQIDKLTAEGLAIVAMRADEFTPSQVAVTLKGANRIVEARIGARGHVASYSDRAVFM